MSIGTIALLARLFTGSRSYAPNALPPAFRTDLCGHLPTDPDRKVTDPVRIRRSLLRGKRARQRRGRVVLLARQALRAAADWSRAEATTCIRLPT
jgi:hypothetical protein